MNNELDEYLEQHCTEPDAVLNALSRHTQLCQINPRMMSGQIQGKFLEMLCASMQATRVLEIGSFTGYSTICLAKGLSAQGKLTAIEINEEYEDIIREYLSKAEVETKVELIIGDARQVIPSLSTIFDLVFIDADKTNNSLYFDLIIDKVRPGGIILVDNVLWNNKVLHPQAKDHDTNNIMAFNDKIQTDNRVDNLILPLRDGLMMIRKR